MKVDALILAGKSNIREVEDIRAEDKPRFPINGKPMYEYVIDAARNSKLINRIVVTVPVATDCSSFEYKVDKVLFTDQPVVNNILMGVEYLSDTEFLLVLSSDLPLLTSEVIDTFMTECEKEGDFDLYYPVHKMEDVLDRYPTTKRTYARIAEGKFTGSNAALFKPFILKNNVKLFKRIFDQRKNPIGMARVIGINCMIKALRGTLSIELLEERIGKLIGGRGKAIISKQIEMGIDVDKKEDLELVESILSGDKGKIVANACF
jgi:molybdopterin-guanine dinucleotide biosynthesis protein A